MNEADQTLREGVAEPPANAISARTAGLVIVSLLGGIIQWVVYRGFFSGSEDFVKYVDAARRFALEPGSPGALHPERLADFSPAYLALHRLAQWLPQPAQAVVVLQIVLVGASGGLVWWWLRGRGVALWLAVLAAAVYLTETQLLVYGTLLEPEALMLFLVMLLLAALDKSERTPADGESTALPFSAGWLVLAGAVCAVAVLTRPTLLPSLVIVPVWLFLAFWRPGRKLRPLLLGALCFAAPVLLALGALAVRHASAFGEASPTVMNPGTVFFEGNNPASWGGSASYPPAVFEVELALLEDKIDPPHNIYRELARVDLGPRASIASVNRYWRQKALAYVVDHPRRFLRVVLLKLDSILRADAHHDVADGGERERALRSVPLPRLPFPFLVFSAVWGVAAAVRRGMTRHELWLVLMLAAAQVAAMLAFYVSARQRLTLLPLLVLLAAWGWHDLAVGARSGRSAQRVLCGIVLAAILGLSLLFLSPAQRTSDRNSSGGHGAVALELSRRSQQARDQGDFESARVLAAQALASAPFLADEVRPASVSFPEGYAELALTLAQRAPTISEASQSEPGTSTQRFDRALLLAAAGERLDARELFEALTAEGKHFYRSARVSSLPEVHVARLEALEGDRGASRERLLSVLEDEPGEPFALAWLVALRTEESSAARLALDRYYDSTSAALLVGRAHCELGQRSEADSELRKVVEAHPAMRRAAVYLSVCGDAASELARARYMSTMRLAVEPVLLEERVVALAAEPPSGVEPFGATLERLQILRQLGRFVEANDLIGRSLGREDITTQQEAALAHERAAVSRALASR